MASSGVNTFVLERDQLIKSSLEDVGAIVFGATVPTALNDLGQVELNKEVQSLQGQGVKLWSRDWITGISISSGSQSYAFSQSDILSIDRVNMVQNNVSYPVQLMDVDAFFDEIGSLDTTGRPTFASVEPSFDSGSYKFNLRFYPIPDQDYDFEVLASKKLDDFTTGTDNPAFPSRWYDALQYGLSYRMAPKFGQGQDRIAFFRARYYEAISQAKKTDFTNNERTISGLYNYQR